MDLTPLRLWLATLNPGTPWLALFAVLALLLRLSLHERVAPYVVVFLGPKYREIVGAILVTFGGLFPALTSASRTPEADAALGALSALVVALIGLWRPPKPPAEPPSTPASEPRPSPLPPSARSVLLLVGVVFLVGCARQGCLFDAETAAGSRSDDECIGPAMKTERFRECETKANGDADALDACSAWAWDECESRMSIMTELESAQKECRQ